MPLSTTATASFYDELEKIASVAPALAGSVAAALVGTAVGLGGTALYLHGNARQDSRLRDMGFISPEETQRRQRGRIAAMVGVASAMGLGGMVAGGVAGVLAPVAQKHLRNLVTDATKGMWENASTGLRKAISEGGEEVAMRARKEIELGLEKQVEHGDMLLKKQMEYGHKLVMDSAPELSEQVGDRAVKSVMKHVPFFGRRWR